MVYRGFRQRLRKLAERDFIQIWKEEPTAMILAIVLGVVIGIKGGQLAYATLDNHFHMTLYDYFHQPR